MSEDKSLDLVGVGRVAKAIPAAAWKRVVETGCSTFEKVVAPLTETTSGLGRLIGAKFDRLVDAEKVIVANTAQTASEKVERSGKSKNDSFNHLILCKLIEHAQSQAEPSLRELWSNLLAREMTQGGVHPEIADVLARLTTKDAMLLIEIAKEEKEEGSILSAVAALTANLPILRIGLTMKYSSSSFHHIILDRLGLIGSADLGWRLTAFGVAFLETVAPVSSDEKKKPAQNTNPK